MTREYAVEVSRALDNIDTFELMADRIILAQCSNGYCGCDSEDVFFFDDSMTDIEITEEILYWAQEQAESYSYVHFGWGEPYTDEEYEDYLENYVSFDWHVATYEEYLDWCDNWNYEPKTEAEIAEMY